jgi:hypothetical protein
MSTAPRFSGGILIHNSMTEHDKKPPSNIYDNDEALVDFFGGLLDKTYEFVHHFDTQTNILVGISTAVVAIAASGVRSETSPFAFFVLGAFSSVSVILGLYSIHPPKFMRKKQQRESIFYNKNIIHYGSPEQYAAELTRTLKDKHEFVAQNTMEMHNLFKYYYRPKRTLFKLSRNFLMVGIILATVIYYFQNFNFSL